MAEANKFSDIEDQLLKEGFVTTEDVGAARDAFRESIEKAKRPLGMIISEMVDLSQDELKEVLWHPASQEMIGNQAVKQQKMSLEQLDECRGIAAEEGLPLILVMTRKAYLDERDRNIMIALVLNHIDFAKLLIRLSLISERSLEQALKQKNHRKTVCEILYDRNLVTLTELNHVFRKFNQELKLGEILLRQGLITEIQLTEVLSEQCGKRQSLGRILLQKQYVGIEQLYFSLSIQYNTPFQRLDGYVYYEKQKAELKSVVGQQYALENRIVPLFQNGNNLTLAVSNPSDIWSMNGLKAIYPELQMSCVLITDEKFNQLYALLYGEFIPFSIPQNYELKPTSSADSLQSLEDPAMQKDLMRRLYDDYAYYREIVGGKPFDADESWFYEFIMESHRDICNAYGCREVIYRFEIVSNRVEIQASPGR